MMCKRLTFFILASIIFLLVILYGCQKNSSHNLLVFCGAGMKIPMDKAAKTFMQSTGIQVKVIYAGSITLLSQISLSQKGDLYIPGNELGLDLCRQKKLAALSKPLAKHIPVIIVSKNNPAQIATLKDLAKPGIRLALGDEKSCAIGKLSNRLFRKNDISNTAINKNVVLRTANVTELLTPVALGQVDAAIVWKSTVGQERIIFIPEQDNIIQTIPVVLLNCSKDKNLSKQLFDYLIKSTGKEVFKLSGYEVY